jgi:hypothetical protein
VKIVRPGDAGPRASRLVPHGEAAAGHFRRPAEASIHDLQLAGQEPRRDVVAKPRSEPLRRPNRRRQRFDFDDDSKSARRDGRWPEWFDKADFLADRVHDLATISPLSGPSR